MDPLTKSYVSIGLVVLALFEFWTAMRILGRKGGAGKHARLLLRLHRVGGYVFLVYFVWISWICFGILARLSSAGGYQLDSRAAIHSTLAFALFFILLLKISFTRIYRNYRQYVPMLGIILTIGTLVLWGIAGLMFIFMMGNVQPAS